MCHDFLFLVIFVCCMTLFFISMYNLHVGNYFGPSLFESKYSHHIIIRVQTRSKWIIHQTILALYNKGRRNWTWGGGSSKVEINPSSIKSKRAVSPDMQYGTVGAGFETFHLLKSKEVWSHSRMDGIISLCRQYCNENCLESRILLAHYHVLARSFPFINSLITMYCELLITFAINNSQYMVMHAVAVV